MFTNSQALAIQLRDDLESISNRVNQCATKQSGDLPTQSQLDKAKTLFSNPLKEWGSVINLVEPNFGKLKFGKLLFAFYQEL